MCHCRRSTGRQRMNGCEAEEPTRRRASLVRYSVVWRPARTSSDIGRRIQPGDVVGEIDSIGVANNKYGVCGFTSSLYALYARRPDSDMAAGARIETRIMAEIKTYLMMLKVDGRADLLSDIKNFTTTFPGYSGFTIDGYIQQINAALKLGIPNFS